MLIKEPNREITYKERQYLNSNISPRYFNKELRTPKVDVEAYNRLNEIKENVVDFVKSGKNLNICSNYVGNGKTQWAVNIALNYIENVKYVPNGYPVLFINVPEFLVQLKAAINDIEIAAEVHKIEKAVYTADLVILDDFGDANISQYDYAMIYSWINYRTSNLKSTIYTSNSLPENLYNEFPLKLVDRVLGYSETIVLNSQRHRGEE